MAKKKAQAPTFQVKKSAVWAGVVLQGFGSRQGAMKNRKRYDRKANKQELRKAAGE